jgi:energy-coupling factor transporter ATP-binding protein EcfA2
MTTPLANYEDERRAFEALLEPECQTRILLLHGASGCGKTTLLTYYRQRVPPSWLCLSIQLRSSAVSIAEIFYRAGRVLTWERFPTFMTQVADFQELPTVQIDHNQIIGMDNRITVALTTGDPADRGQRQTALTDAWFDDLSRFQRPVLILFDTYNDAITDVQEWLSGPFLARTEQAQSVRIVIAGQQVPDHHNIEWGHCCTLRQLYGVREARHWMPVVQNMQRLIPFDNPEAWLAGVCHALEGDPQKIMKVIEGLQRLPEVRV